MAKVSFIYFDLGGVMFHYEAALIQIAHENGLALTDFNTVLKNYDYKLSIGTISIQEIWEIYKKKLDLRVPHHINFFEYWTDRFVPILPIHHLVTRLSQTYPIGILSNMYAHVLEKSRQKHFIPDITYASIIESYKVKCAKPDKKIYKIAQDHADVLPDEILFIDDKEENIRTAKKLGWQTVHFNTIHVSKSIETIKYKTGLKN